MNTCSKQFQNLIHQYPNERDALQKLEALFQKSATFVDLDGLFALARPSSSYALVNILKNLVEAKCISKCYLVVSPTNGEGIKEFSSFMEIPKEIEDSRSHYEVIPVTPSLVHVKYRPL